MFTFFQVPELVVHCQKLIIHQFLFNYHKDEDKVLRGLVQVLSMSQSASNIKEKVVSKGSYTIYKKSLIISRFKFLHISSGNFTSVLDSTSSR